MYKKIKSSKYLATVNVIDITVVFDFMEEALDVQTITQNMVSEKYKLSDTQIDLYYDFVDTARSVILGHFKEILEEKRSVKNHSSYAVVKTDIPIPSNQKTYWKFAFHGLNFDSPENESVIAIIGKEQRFTSLYEVLMAICRICNNISKGIGSGVPYRTEQHLRTY